MGEGCWCSLSWAWLNEGLPAKKPWQDTQDMCTCGVHNCNREQIAEKHGLASIIVQTVCGPHPQHSAPKLRFEHHTLLCQQHCESSCMSSIPYTAWLPPIMRSAPLAASGPRRRKNKPESRCNSLETSSTACMTYMTCARPGARISHRNQGLVRILSGPTVSSCTRNGAVQRPCGHVPDACARPAPLCCKPKALPPVPILQCTSP